MVVKFEDDRFYTRVEVRARGINVCAMQFLRYEKQGLTPRKANGNPASRTRYLGADLNRFFSL